MAHCCFVEGYKDFPVCNHIKEIGSENIGYQTGMLDDESDAIGYGGRWW